MMSAQFIGALFSMYVFFEVIEETQEDGTVDPEDFPHLDPKSQYWQQAMVLEMFCTFIFVSNVLLVKDERASKFSHTIGGHHVNFLGCAIIALALAGTKIVATPVTGGSLNPAVSVAQKIMSEDLLKDVGGSRFLWRVYMLGPFLGAVLSGVCSLGHNLMLREFGPQLADDIKAEEQLDLKKDEEQIKKDEKEEEEKNKADPESKK